MHRRRNTVVAAAIGMLLALVWASAPVRAEERGAPDPLAQKMRELTERARKARSEERFEEYRRLTEEIARLRMAMEKRERKRRMEREELHRRLKLAEARLHLARRKGDEKEIQAIEEEMHKLRRMLKEGGQAPPPPPEHGPGGPEAEREREELNRKLRHLEKEREKALENFDLDGVDRLTAHIEKVRAEMERLEEARKDGGPPEAERKEREAELFARLKQALARGDEEEVQRLREAIHRLRRGSPARSLLPELADRFGRVRDKVEKMIVESEMEGHPERAADLRHLLEVFGDLEDKCRQVRTPGQLREFGGLLEDILSKGRKGLREADEERNEHRAKLLAWVLGHIEEAGEILRKKMAAHEKSGEAGGARGAIEELRRRAEALESEGRHEEAEEHRRKAEELERRLHGGGPDGKERMALAEKLRHGWMEMARLKRWAAQARLQGEPEKAEKLEDKARALGRELEELRRKLQHAGRGRRFERPRDHGDRPGEGRSRPRGPRRERDLDRLRRAIEEAEHQGRFEEAEKLRQELRKREERMRDRPGDGPDRGVQRRDGDDGPSREARELKREIDRLREELAELKKLLKALLRERGKD